MDIKKYTLGKLNKTSRHYKGDAVRYYRVQTEDTHCKVYTRQGNSVETVPRCCKQDVTLTNCHPAVIQTLEFPDLLETDCRLNHQRIFLIEHMNSPPFQRRRRSSDLVSCRHRCRSAASLLRNIDCQQFIYVSLSFMKVFYCSGRKDHRRGQFTGRH